MAKRLCVLLYFVLFFCVIHAQKTEKRIYILDWTKTMVGWENPRTLRKYPDVWKDFKKLIVKNIKQIDETTTDVVLLCFEANIKHRFTSKKEILNFLEDEKNEPDGWNTNLSLPWRKALEEIDHTKYNFITYLTDGGEQNVRGEVPFDECILSTSRGAWKDIISRNDDVYMCFVRLTDDALDPKVLRALENTDKISILNGIQFPSIIKFEKKQYNYNIRDFKKLSVTIGSRIINKAELSANNQLKVEVSHPALLKVEDIDFDYKSETLKFNIQRLISDEELNELPENIAVTLNISPKVQEFTVIHNSSIRFNFKNIKETNAIVSGSVSNNKANYYPSFLFKNELNAPIGFNVQSEKGRFAPKNYNIVASVHLKLNEKGSEFIPTNHYKVRLNGVILDSNSFTLDTEKYTDNVELLFTSKAEPSSYKLVVDFKSNNLDEIYPGRSIELGKVKYVISMNPLKKFMYIVITILLALLLIWKLFLIYLVFPRINKFNTLMIQSSDSISVRIRGARMVCLSTAKHSQSWLNKFFTGKIIYIQQPIWINGDIQLTPKTTGRQPYKLIVTNSSKYLNLPRYIDKSVNYSFYNNNEIIIIRTV